jgi:hypothetical protein
MLPQGVGWIAVEDDTGCGLHDKWQEVTEDLWRRRHHAIRRQEGPEHVRVPQRVGEHQLGQHAGGQSEIDPDRIGMPAAHTTADADNQLVLGQRGPDRLDQWVHALLAAIDNRATADFDDVAVRQHAHHWCFSRGHHLLVEQALAHQQGPNVVSAIGHWLL